MAGDVVETTREVLLGCLSVPRWADDVLAGQPYDDRAALLGAADAAARPLAREGRGRRRRPRVDRRGAGPGPGRAPEDRGARRSAPPPGAGRDGRRRGGDGRAA